MKRSTVLIFLFGAVALTGWRAFAADETKKIVVGPDTTRVDGPMLKDGTIDYPAAILSSIKQGITEQNNSWPVMEKALGLWKKFPEGTTKAGTALIDEKDRSRARPWKMEELPEAAAWLKDNEKALELVTEASAKGRLLMPEWMDEKTGDLTRGPGLGTIAEMGMAFQARAMMEIAAGEQDKARQDTATLRRLARQLIAEPSAIQGLVGDSLDDMASRVALAGARAGNIEDARKWLKESQAVPEVRMNLAAVDMRERYEKLNLVMRILHGQANNVLSDLTQMNLESMFLASKAGAAVNPGDLDQTDWNTVLRRINATYDTAAAILKLEDPQKRRAAWEAFQKDLRKDDVPGNFFDALGDSLLNKEGDYETQKKKMLAKVEAYLKRGKDETLAAFSERIAHYFIRDAWTIQKQDDLLTRSIATQRITTLALAVMIYHSEKGAYPETLDAVKELIGSMPVDPFTGKAFGYRNDAAGCRIYSAGADGKDDGGAKGSDDVVVEVGQ